MKPHFLSQAVADFSNLQFTPPVVAKIQTESQANYASEFYRKLSECIIEFEAELTTNEELAIRLVTFGESVIIHVSDIGYYNPSLINFAGTTADGKKVKLVQHVSQLSFLLMAVPTLEPIEERERVGFKLRHEREADSLKDQPK